MTERAPTPGSARCRVLRDYGIAENQLQPEFDDRTRHAALACGTAIASLSFVNGSHEWFASSFGFDFDPLNIEQSIGAEVLNRGAPLILERISADSPFLHSPLASERPRIAFYAGVPLIRADGVAFGVLAVMDSEPRRLNERQLALLEEIATEIVNQLERRRRYGEDNVRNEETSAVDYYELFDCSPVLHVVVEPNEFRFVAVNEAFLKATGRRREELLGKRVQEAFPENPDDPESLLGVENLQRILERVRSTGKTDRLPVQRYPIPVGNEGELRFEERYWTIIISPLFDSRGQLTGILQAVEDITELIQTYGDDTAGRDEIELRGQRMEAEISRYTREVNRLNDHLRMAQRVAGLGSWQIDPSNDRRVWSDEMYRITGTTPKMTETGSDALFRLIHPDDLPLFMKMHDRVLNGEELPNGFEHRIVRPDGEVRHVRERIRAQRGKDGRPVLLYGTLEDVTEQKQTAQELETRARQQEAVAKLGEAALQSDNLQALFDEAVKAVAATLGVEFCKVLELLPGGKEVKLVSGVGWKEGLVGHATVGTGLDSQAGYTLRSDKPVIVYDLRTEKRFSGPSLLRDHGVVSGISVIIRHNRRPWGVLGAHTQQRLRFTDDDVNFFQSVANILAASIQRFESATELNMRARQQAAVARLGQKALQRVPLEDLQAESARLITETLGVRFSKVLMRLPKERGMKFVAGNGWKAGLVGNLILPVGAGTHAAYTMQHSPVVIDDIREEKRFEPSPILLEHEALSGISVIIEGSDGPWGVLCAYAKGVRRFTQDDVNFCQSMANVLAETINRRETDERLRKNESLRRIAGQMARLGAWRLTSPDGRLELSEEACNVLGVPAGSKPTFGEALSFVHRKHRASLRGMVRQSFIDARTFDVEVPLTDRGSACTWVRVIGQAVTDSEGAVVELQGALQDVSESKAAATEVRELAQRLTSTLESITDAFFTLDHDWRFTYVNKRAEQLLDKSREELLGTVVWEQFSDAVDSEFYREYHRAVDEQRTVEFEAFYSPFDKWLGVVAYPSRDGLAVYFRDVTERRQAEEDVRASEERVRAIIETALDGMITIDQDSLVTGWNPQAEAIFGWKRKEVIGQPLHELIIPHEYREAHIAGMNHFLRTGEGALLNRRMELPALRRNGERFTIELAISPLTVRGSYRFNAFVRDITERKRNEAALVESEERFRVVARATADTIWDWNLLTDTVWWNEGLQTVFGYSPDDVESDSRSFRARIDRADRARIERILRDAIEHEDRWQAEHGFLRKDGSVAHVKVRGFVIRDDQGRPLRMIGAMDDVTQQRQYEERLQQQAALLDRSQDAIIVRDMDDRITFWNKSAERLYGWSATEALGNRKHELLNSEQAVYLEASRTLLETGEWSGQIVQQRKDGSTLTVEAAWSLVTDDDGKPEAVLTIDTDITQRLALEEQLRQSQRLEAVGQLTGGVAHDFNNLLTVILGNAELMVDQLPDDSRMHKLAEMTRSAAVRGAELTHRLLAFARRQALEPKVVDVNDLVVGMEGLLRRALPEHIDIEVMQAEGLWDAYVDPAQLESVLLNLALNAKDAMQFGGQLTIETGNANLDDEYTAHNAEVAPGRYVLVAVSDTGTGIPRDLLDRVFDPFFTTKEKGKGTGLGLSMAYGFAKQSGGHIKIYSEPDQGTTVKVYLPRAQRAGETTVADRSTDNDLSGSEKILVVEDDDLVRAHAQSQLTEFGYKVITATNGPEALEVLESEPDIDLLFTDVIMSGGMNGRELAEVAKRLRPKLKVLYTSGYTENAIVHHGRLDEGVQLLQKPYRRHDLAMKVRGALSQNQEDSSGKIQ